MKICRGEIWLTNFDPVVGSEISKTRPALVVSHSSYNAIAETVSVLPISTGRYLKSFHVYIKEMKDNSHAIIPQIRVASKERFIKRLGKSSLEEMEEIGEKLLRYLDLKF